MTPLRAGPNGRFNLIDHNGGEVSEASYAGRYALIFFGFTRCRVVCPRALTKTSEALDLLGALANDVHPLYVTVDPVRDDVATMRTFLGAWPRFTGLTGTPAQVDAAKREFIVFVKKQGDDVDPAISHTAFSHLLDPAGRHVDHWGDHITSDEIAARLKHHLQG